MSQSHPELGCCSQETRTPQLAWVPQNSLNFMMNIESSTYSDGDDIDIETYFIYAVLYPLKVTFYEEKT